MATPRKNTATGQDVSGDVVGPDGEKVSGDQAPAPVESAPSVAPIDAPEPVTTEEVRAAKLEALLSGEDEEAKVPAEELGYDPNADVVDFGGRTVCVVLFTAWNAIVDGVFKTSPKGSLVRVMADEADRGERLGGLKRVDL
ncbi:hypothetical protein SEA_BOLT007_9 [Arthrobacter phage Bolt007]|uniref:Uncharacterized protein n=1 Tax=Arthrobacter phage Bolt007 TaxID=3017297 RepID=A0AA49E454_9CAUD|nr:hypothetical protein SEA_BOLT007_9 [Arthrobacter phage Bolt007]